MTEVQTRRTVEAHALHYLAAGCDVSLYSATEEENEHWQEFGRSLPDVPGQLSVFPVPEKAVE